MPLLSELLEEVIKIDDENLEKMGEEFPKIKELLEKLKEIFGD